MVTSQFNALLQELESFFKCKLEPDQNNSCLIKIGSDLRIQIELDRTNENLLVGAKVGIIPPGRYRELVFKEAAKSNDNYTLGQGVFGFSKTSGQLILFATLDLRDINQEKMINALTPFIAKAQHWMKTIAQEEVPTHIDPNLITSKPSLFGLVH